MRLRVTGQRDAVGDAGVGDADDDGLVGGVIASACSAIVARSCVVMDGASPVEPRSV
jgi:hypothetical protein